MAPPRPETRSQTTGPPPCSDGELLVRHRQGDPSAFAEFVAAYRQPVYSYLVRSGIEEAARDDLFQEIFAAIHRAAAAYEPERPLKPWVFAVVANAVRSHYRKARGRARAVAAHARQRDDRAAPDSEVLAEGREMAAWIECAIAALPASQREVIVLCCIEQLPQHDAATALGIPLNTVKTHLRRARLALARGLARHMAEQDQEGST